MKRKREIEHGVVILATARRNYKPHSFGYGKSDKVMTQLELSGRLARKEINLPEKATIVMIQCVEQRTADRPYCSRVCCTTAVKNALLLRERYPKARIVVLYREMRTYGFREAAYKEARDKGVLFVRYDVDRPPVVSEGGGAHGQCVRQGAWPRIDHETRSARSGLADRGARRPPGAFGASARSAQRRRVLSGGARKAAAR